MGITGAWFTRTASESGGIDKSDIVIGQIGSVSITLSDVDWQESDRGYFMPGDTVVGGGLTLTYEPENSNDDGVYYLVYKVENTGTEQSPVYEYTYYTVDDGELSEESDECGVLDADHLEVSVGGTILIDDADQDTNTLAGEDTKAWGNTYMNLTISFEISLEQGVVYHLAAIQKANLTAATAFDELTGMIEHSVNLANGGIYVAPAQP